jgi:hypothetical protein
MEVHRRWAVTAAARTDRHGKDCNAVPEMLQLSQSLTVAKGNVPQILVSTNPEFIGLRSMRSANRTDRAGRMEFCEWLLC